MLKLCSEKLIYKLLRINTHIVHTVDRFPEEQHRTPFYLRISFSKKNLNIQIRFHMTIISVCFNNNPIHDNYLISDEIFSFCASFTQKEENAMSNLSEILTKSEDPIMTMQDLLEKHRLSELVSDAVEQGKDSYSRIYYWLGELIKQRRRIVLRNAVAEQVIAGETQEMACETVADRTGWKAGTIAKIIEGSR